ncbi:hypothetical protein J6590_098030 [Homalodisca vitripennis]|nr:hypothetical protein J6590_098030 [Homalodisca vitripennis]
MLGSGSHLFKQHIGRDNVDGGSGFIKQNKIKLAMLAARRALSTDAPDNELQENRPDYGRALITDAPGNELYRRTDRITGETDVLEIIRNVGSQTSTEYGRPGRALSTDAPGNELYRRDRITGETDVLEIISNVGSQTSTEYGRPG